MYTAKSFFKIADIGGGQSPAVFNERLMNVSPHWSAWRRKMAERAFLLLEPLGLQRGLVVLVL